MSDSIDFESWNATVRALTMALDKLDRTVGQLANAAWAQPLVKALEELTLTLQASEEIRSSELAGGPDALAGCSREPGRDAAEASTSIPQSSETPHGEREGPTPHDSAPTTIRANGTPPVRFGDPDAIACYGRRRRR